MKTVNRNLRAEEIRDLVGDSPFMLEIGSHEGADTARFLAAMPGIRLHCFEPEQRAVARFKQAVGDDHRVKLYEKAVADIDGPKPFYASTGRAADREDWDFSGSLHAPTGHLTRSPEIKFKPPVSVPCIRLDSWLAPDQPGDVAIDFIWADVQGGQRDLIAGGRRTLGMTRYLYIKCHSIPLYDGEPTQANLIEELNGIVGFEPLAVYDRENILFRNRHIQ